MKQEEMSLEDYHKLGKPQRPAGRRKGQTPEGIVLSSIMRYLSYMPERVYAVRTNSGVIPDSQGHMIRLAPTGTADITGYISLNTRIGKVAVFMAIEVKAGKNTPTPAQEGYLDGVTQAGGFAMVARSVGEVQERLEAFIKEMEGR